ncbi:MAG: 50S ribosomal protein L35 [Lentisphaerae bacterium]|nr:50S ribosomal protein L35 [Lentisphaerota bacterium]
MPKKKTNKAAAKRFKVTAKGKLKYARCGGRHLMTTSKNRKRKRTIGKPGILDKAEMKRIHRLLST